MSLVKISFVIYCLQVTLCPFILNRFLRLSIHSAEEGRLSGYMSAFYGVERSSSKVFDCQNHCRCVLW